MIFNSIDFLLFFLAVYALYWTLGHKLQNRFLLLASLFFYGFWDPRFLALLMASTVVDYFAALGIEKNIDNPKKRKLFLTVSLLTNLGILGFFKYFNFFVDSALSFLGAFGFQADPFVLQVILPLGISFYTFQTMSYTIDVYRNQLKPVRNFFDFSLYVSFFPQLVAGPIERATRLLPQIQEPRKWNLKQVQEGGFLVLLGFFKKVFVADNIGTIVNDTFSQEDPSGAVIIITLIGFAFQVYCDFSGYSDIARGISKWMGFELMRNFNVPVLSVNIMDLWKRWHISLMSWFRDYLYIPLGGNRVSETRQHINNIFIFFVSGLWHGASWNFVIWGVYNGILTSGYRIIQPLLPKLPGDDNKFIFLLKYLIKVITTFSFFAYSGIWFRSQTFDQAIHIHTQILSAFGDWDGLLFTKLIKLIFVLMIIEISQYRKDDEFSVFKWRLPARIVLYVTLFYSITIMGNFNKNEFIYFVF